MNRCSTLAVCTLLFAVGCGADAADASPPIHTVLAQESASEAPQSLLTGAVTGAYDGAPFTGTLSLVRFAAEEGTVYAIGKFSEVAGIPEAAAAALQAAAVKLPLSVAPAAGFPEEGSEAPIACDVLTLYLRPLQLALETSTVVLDKVDIDVSTTPGGGNVLASMLCGAPSLLESGGHLTGLQGDFATLLSILDGLTGLPFEEEPSAQPTVTAVPVELAPAVTP